MYCALLVCHVFVAVWAVCVVGPHPLQLTSNIESVAGMHTSLPPNFGSVRMLDYTESLLGFMEQSLSQAYASNRLDWLITAQPRGSHDLN